MAHGRNGETWLEHPLKSNGVESRNPPAKNKSKITKRDGRDEILVLKLDENGNETWRYLGRVLERKSNLIRLEARFDREDMDFYGLQLRNRDRFLETFYNDRWYNIFEIHDRDDDHLKGWYCNIGFPAELYEDKVSYRDLALDLVVFPDGRQLVLDFDEFYQLKLDETEKTMALIALESLQEHFNESAGFSGNAKNPEQ